MNFFAGKIDFEIKGDNLSRLISVIFKSGIECRNLVNYGECLKGSCNKSVWKKLAYECEKLNLSYEFNERKSFNLFIGKLLKRKGLIAGFIVGFVLLTFLSNTFLRLRVKCENKEIQDKIETYILSKGIEYGDFIPEIDIYGLELDIMREVEEVSWAGIYITGGTINVDIVEKVTKPEYNQKRLPSDIVALKSGEIVSVEIYSGKLLVPVGSGVHEGQTLVSGIVDLSEEMTVLRRSQGKIYAKVTYNESFYCPYENTEKLVSKTPEKKHYLHFFSLDIPLSIKDYDGMYQVKEKYKPLMFLGNELPISYKTEEYYKYQYKNTTFNEEKATEEVYKLAENFKDNFLSECEILEENEEISIDEEGVRLDKTFVVIENIALEKEILIK